MNHETFCDSFDAQRNSLKIICFNRFFGCVFKLFFQAKWFLIDPKFTKANAMVTATAAPTSLPAQRVVHPVPQCPRRPRVLQRNLLARSMGIQIPPRSRVCRYSFCFLPFFGGEPKNKHQKTRFEGEILKHGWEVFFILKVSSQIFWTKEILINDQAIKAFMYGSDPFPLPCKEYPVYDGFTLTLVETWQWRIAKVPDQLVDVGIHDMCAQMRHMGNTL